VVLPVLHKHGLTLLQFPTVVVAEANIQPALRTRLSHAATGEFMEDTMLTVGKADPQGQGSGITYARRYSVLAILGLAPDEDDDGNGLPCPGGGRVVENAGNASTTPAQSGAGVKF
jgi:hypothetical protein